MNITNNHIVFIIMTITIITFIYNYDVYIIEKNKPICKPIYITKKILNDEKQEPNKKSLEGFEKYYDNTTSKVYIPKQELLDFSVNINNKHNNVMNNVIAVLSNIPTNIQITDIKQMIQYYGSIYENSESLELFYKNISHNNRKFSNYKYSQLIIYLISKFDNIFYNKQSIINNNKNNNKNNNNLESFSKFGNIDYYAYF